ncbi:unnamed protein product, partial [Didymodactylos carnosus]
MNNNYSKYLLIYTSVLILISTSTPVQGQDTTTESIPMSTSIEAQTSALEFIKSTPIEEQTSTSEFTPMSTPIEEQTSTSEFTPMSTPIEEQTSTSEFTPMSTSIQEQANVSEFTSTSTPIQSTLLTTYNDTWNGTTIVIETTIAETTSIIIPTTTSIIMPTTTIFCYPFVNSKGCINADTNGGVLVTSIILGGLSLIGAIVSSYMVVIRKTRRFRPPAQNPSQHPMKVINQS